MFKPLQFNLFEGEFDLLYVLGDDDVVNGFGVKSLAVDRHHFIVREVNGLTGVLDDGGGIRGDDVFSVSDAED